MNELEELLLPCRELYCIMYGVLLIMHGFTQHLKSGFIKQFHFKNNLLRMQLLKKAKFLFHIQSVTHMLRIKEQSYFKHILQFML